MTRRGSPGAGWLVEDFSGDAEAAARVVALHMGAAYMVPGSKLAYDLTVTSEGSEADIAVHLDCEVSVQIEIVAVRLIPPGATP